MEVEIKPESQEDGWTHMGITDDNTRKHFNYSSDVKQEQTEDGWELVAIKDENSDDVKVDDSDNNTVLRDKVSHSCDGILVDCDHDYCGDFLNLTCVDVPCQSRRKKRKTYKQRSTKAMRRALRSEANSIRWPAKFSIEELHALCTQYPEITTIPTDRNEIILALRAARRHQRRQQKLAALTPRELKRYRSAEAAEKRKKREQYWRNLTQEERKAFRDAEAAKVRERRKRQLSVERLQTLCTKNNIDIEIRPDNLIKGKRALEAARKRKLRLQKLASLTPEQLRTTRLVENAKRRIRRLRLELATLTPEEVEAKRALEAAVKRKLRLGKLASLTPQQFDATRIRENAKRRMRRVRKSANRTVDVIPSWSQQYYQQNCESPATGRVTAVDVEGQHLLLDGLTVDQLEAVANDDELREQLDQLCQMFKCQKKEQGMTGLLFG